MVRPADDASLVQEKSDRQDGTHHVRFRNDAVDFLQHHNTDHAEYDMIKRGVYHRVRCSTRVERRRCQNHKSEQEVAISLTLQNQAPNWRHCRALIDECSIAILSFKTLRGTFLGIHLILQSEERSPLVKSKDRLFYLECDSYPMTYPVRLWEVETESCRPWR